MRRTVTAFVVSVVLMTGGVIAQQKRQQDIDLQAAIRAETVDGDLNGAIKQYGAIVSKYKADRVVTATALVHMAECHQKLGDAESRNIYERIVREYADQTNAVTIARVRLGERRSSGTGMVARQLWTTTGYSQVSIANDGRTAAVVEQSSPDGVIRDLTTGQTTRLKLPTDPASGAYAEWPVLSPDRLQLAYAYSGPDIKWNYQLRVGGNQSDAKARALGDTFPYMYVTGWAPDGKSILVTILEEGNKAQIAWMSTTDGRISTLKSVDWQTGNRPALSPDGRFIAYDAWVGPGKPDREIRIMASDSTREITVAPAPGINASPIWSRDGSQLVFKSNRSGSFGIWSVPVRDGHGDGSATRLKADVGEIELIGFSATGSLLYEHRSGTADIFAMDLDPQAGKTHGEAVRLVETFLGSNVNPAASPDGKSLAYHRRTGASNQWSNLVIRLNESGAERVIPTVFRYAGAAMWAADGQTIIQPARNSENNATFYKVDVKSGDVATAFTTGTRGPGAALSPNGRTVYTSTTMPDRRVLVAFDLGSGVRTNLSHEGSASAVDASPDGRSIAFVAWDIDRTPSRAHLYVADADGNRVRAILTTDKPDELPNRGGIKWSSDSRFIYFLQRSKGSLWRISAAGGAPTLVGELTKSPVQTIDVTRDGRVIFGTDSRPTVEIWALENFLPAPSAKK